jgi:cobalt/nickel transport protein
MRLFRPVFVFTLVLLFSTSVQAHFGMVIPSHPIVTQEQKVVDLTLSFSHPFEGIGMDMVKPSRFFVVQGEESTDLLAMLQETQIMNHRAWQTSQKPQRPGVYQYVMEPAPYWEPAEDLFIIHYTKTIVAAFGADQGWDEAVGLPTEIVPMLRPFGNYSGNTFTGQVLIGGKPAASSEVEVEFYNRDHALGQPSDYHITQVVKTDANGVFNFTCPWSGWWGFSALSEADYTMSGPDNKEKAVELGAVLWIFFDAPTPAVRQ